jgi:hypothetical protein
MNFHKHQIQHSVDFCVVGGGMAGLVASLAAARRGARVLLMHERPVLGGNASSECRVHICGADRHNAIKNMRETGILEELRLENLYRNPNRNFSIWDTLLYEKAQAEPNLELLLNCTCQEAEMEGNTIRSITGWQMTTQTYHTVTAKIFADCSGDAVLALLTGAGWRMGREARSEYGEAIAPEQADERTMGMTCLFQSRIYPTPQPYEPPAWAHRYNTCAELPYGAGGHRWWQMGYWWVELGGEAHSIYDTETLRDELLKITFGVWDHVKNRCPHKDEAQNWALEWVQFLPAKRESRRYLGAHVLTQNDIAAGGHFDDLVAYGGWTMDDHHPAGFHAVQVSAPATHFHPAPSPYGIAYRCLYSRDIRNLMFAGRDASCTHAAMSSTRVMGTACSMAQAVGTAAALALQKGIEPAGMLEHILELQQELLRDDAYLPWVKQDFSPLMAQSRLTASQGDPSPVRDGTNRPVGKDSHAWTAHPGDSLAYEFEQPALVTAVSLVLDSALDRNIAMSYHQKDPDDPNQATLTAPPPSLPRVIKLEGKAAGNWETIALLENNYQRLVRLPVGRQLEGVRFTLVQTWGADASKVFAFTVK